MERVVFTPQQQREYLESIAREYRGKLGRANLRSDVRNYKENLEIVEARIGRGVKCPRELRTP